MTKRRKKNPYNINLKEVDGKRFRIMWSTKILYTILYLLAWVFISASPLLLTNMNLEITDFTGVMRMITVCGSFILLIVMINSKFLGPIIAVADEKGLYLEAGFIEWKNIRVILYKKDFILRKHGDYCYLEIDAGKQGCILYHAPHKMVRYIKRKAPKVKVKRDKRFLVISAIYAAIGIISTLALMCYKK